MSYIRTSVINGQYAWRAADAYWYITDDRTGAVLPDERYESREHAVAAMRCC